MSVESEKVAFANVIYRNDEFYKVVEGKERLKINAIEVEKLYVVNAYNNYILPDVIEENWYLGKLKNNNNSKTYRYKFENPLPSDIEHSLFYQKNLEDFFYTEVERITKNSNKIRLKNNANVHLKKIKQEELEQEVQEVQEARKQLLLKNKKIFEDKLKKINANLRKLGEFTNLSREHLSNGLQNYNQSSPKQNIRRLSLENNIFLQRLFNLPNNNSKIDIEVQKLIMKLEDFVLDKLVEKVKTIFKDLSNKKNVLLEFVDDEIFKNNIREIQRTEYNFNINDYSSYMFFTVADIKKLDKGKLEILLKDKYILEFSLSSLRSITNATNYRQSQQNRYIQFQHYSSSKFFTDFFDMIVNMNKLNINFSKNIIWVVLPSGTKIFPIFEKSKNKLKNNNFVYGSQYGEPK
jgi:hypothetical protein